MGFTTTSFTVLEPTNPAVEKWQIRYRRQGEGWTEGDEIIPTTGDDNVTVSSLSPGTFDVEVRYDLVGVTGLGRWSGSTVVVIPTDQPAAPSVVSSAPGEFTVTKPTDPNIENWQYRWNLLGGGYFESVELPDSDPDDTRTMLDGGTYFVSVRFDVTGVVRYSEWSPETEVEVTRTVPAPPAAPTVVYVEPDPPGNHRYLVHAPDGYADWNAWELRLRGAPDGGTNFGDWFSFGDLTVASRGANLGGVASAAQHAELTLCGLSRLGRP